MKHLAQLQDPNMPEPKSSHLELSCFPSARCSHKVKRLSWSHTQWDIETCPADRSKQITPSKLSKSKNLNLLQLTRDQKMKYLDGGLACTAPGRCRTLPAPVDVRKFRECQKSRLSNAFAGHRSRREAALGCAKGAAACLACLGDCFESLWL